MATAKDCHTLITYYEKLFKQHYGRAPIVNRNTARWNFDGMLKDMSVQGLKDLLEYYFKTASANSHQLTWFFYNYDKLIEGRQESLDDTEHRKRLREESQQRAQDWRNRFGNQGITSS